MKFLIIGLGNIGEAYKLTRHNLGFLTLDYVAKEQGVTFQVEHLAALASFKYRDRHIYMIQPTTYMNESGKAVSYWRRQFKVPIENSLTIVDDLTLPFAKIRLRSQGSNGGHNGLKSVEAHLGTSAYPRLRMGIDNNYHPGGQSKYVLDPFSKEAQEQLTSYLQQAYEMILSWCTIGIAHTMTKYN